MPSTYGDAQTIEERTHIQVMDIADIETNNRILFRYILRTINFDTFDSLKLFHAVAGQFLLMLLDGFEAEGVDIFDGFGQSVSGYIIGGASLELKVVFSQVTLSIISPPP